MEIYTDLGDLPKIIRIGARGSALAQAQAGLVRDQLLRLFPDLTTELTAIRTHGDVDQTSPLTVIGGQGVFTSAIQRALLAGEIGLAVHSAKDLPSTSTPGLTLVFPLVREDVRDALVSAHGRGLAELPPSPRIGTSSRRRAAQLRALRPDAHIVEIRGNVDTRLRKAEQGEFDAIVLAAAGLHRMGWQQRITAYLPVEQLLPAPGQGALAVEVRTTDDTLLTMMRTLEDEATALCIRVERAFLRAIGAGCAQPVAAYAVMSAGELHFQAMLASDGGGTIERASARLDPDAAEDQAADLARQLKRAIARQPSPPNSPLPTQGEGGSNSSAERGGCSSLGPREVGSEPSVLQEPVRRHLAGWSILVTRPAAQATPLIDALMAAGAEPVAQPAIRIEPPSDSTALDEAIARLTAGDYAWVVFTSVNGVDAVMARLRGKVPPATRVAAVGPSTAAALANAGLAVELIPERHDGEGMLAALLECGVAGQRILLPRADIGRDVLPDGLRHSGALVDDVTAYRTVPIETLDPEVREKLRRHEIDAVTFASGSSVRGLLRQLGGERQLLAGVAVVCIGQATATVARESGLTVAATAAEPSVKGLVAALIATRQTALSPSERNERTT